MLKWFNENGFKYVLLVVLLLLIYVYHDSIKAFLHPTPPNSPVINVTVPKQEVKADTVIVKEVAVEAPTRPGEVLSFVQKEGKVFVINGKDEIEVPNMTGKPTAELGKDGTLRITQEMKSSIDLSSTIKTQADKIAQLEVDKVVAQAKVDADKKHREAKVENIKFGTAGGIIGFVAGFLTHK